MKKLLKFLREKRLFYRGVTMKEKELRYYMFTASANIVLLFSTGAIIQSFLAAVGLSPEQIGKYSFFASVLFRY